MKTIPRGTVNVVHNDSKVGDWLRNLLSSSYIEVHIYPSGETFLEAGPAARPACLILDMRLPGISGLELQRKLNSDNQRLAFIYFTETQDITSVVWAVKQGAIDVINGAVSEEYLVELVHYALEWNLLCYQEEMQLQTLMARFDLLSVRERQVFEGLVNGNTNRAIAAKIHVCQKTVEMHRARLMQKMRASSLADLVKVHCKITDHMNRTSIAKYNDRALQPANQMSLPLSNPHDGVAEYPPGQAIASHMVYRSANGRA